MTNIKLIDVSLFKKISEAYLDNSAASSNWADIRVREILSFLNNKGQIDITENARKIRITTRDEMMAWNKEKGFQNISFDQETLDIHYLLEKLNLNIERYNVCKIEISKSISEFSGKDDLHFELFSENNDSFYAGFKDVDYYNFAIKNTQLTISDIIFREAHTSEIDSKTVEDSILYIACDLTINNKKTSFLIFCRELET